MVLLDIHEAHGIIGFEKVNLKLVENIFILGLVLSVIECLVDLIELFEVPLHSMKVACLEILPCNQVLKMSNEGAYEERANEREHHQNQDKDECKIRADIFHVVVSAPHLVLGDNIPGVEEE